MKINYFKPALVALLCFGTTLQAQTISINSVQDLVRQDRISQRYDQINADGKLVDLNKINGSPYWHKNFEKGKIYLIKQDKTLPAYLRYRIFDDIMEVKKSPDVPDSELYSLQRSKDMRIQIGTHQFVFFTDYPVEIKGTHNGYALVLTSNVQEGDAVLYKRMSQDFVPAKPAANPYSNPVKAKLSGNRYYFVGIEGQLYFLEPDKKDVLNNFPNHQKELKKFISKERLKFRGRNEEEDMIALINYYNTL